MNIKKLHRNMCRDIESRQDMLGEEDDDSVVRFASRFVHNGVKTRKPIVVEQHHPEDFNKMPVDNDDDEDFSDVWSEVG